ncbi:hypothetical protein HK096_006483, partial [Nowakowskiella sp. JEL0078]
MQSECWSPQHGKEKVEEDKLLLRKVTHRAIERRRRERINNKIDQLKLLIPSCAGKKNVHKLATLQLAIEYIKETQTVITQLKDALSKVGIERTDSRCFNEVAQLDKRETSDISFESNLFEEQRRRFFQEKLQVPAPDLHPASFSRLRPVYNTTDYTWRKHSENDNYSFEELPPSFTQSFNANTHHSHILTSDNLIQSQILDYSPLYHQLSFSNYHTSRQPFPDTLLSPPFSEVTRLVHNKPHHNSNILQGPLDVSTTTFNLPCLPPSISHAMKYTTPSEETERFQNRYQTTSDAHNTESNHAREYVQQKYSKSNHQSFKLPSFSTLGTRNGDFHIGSGGYESV